MKNLKKLLKLLSIIVLLIVIIAVILTKKAYANKLLDVAHNSKKLQLEKEVAALANQEFDEEKFDSRLSRGAFSCKNAKLDRQDLEKILFSEKKPSELTVNHLKNYKKELNLIQSLIETKCKETK